jgi:hypothetical protein
MVGRLCGYGPGRAGRIRSGQNIPHDRVGGPATFTSPAGCQPPYGLSHWLAIGPTLGPLATHSFSATDWAHAGTTLALWMAVPLVIGIWRFASRYIS